MVEQSAQHLFVRPIENLPKGTEVFVGVGDSMGEGQEAERISLEPEGEMVKRLLAPKLPSAEEREKHFLMGHVVFRNWCSICVRAMGRDMPHKSLQNKERLLPEYSWDYCFPGDELGFKWTVLVGRERNDEVRMAIAIPMKGGGKSIQQINVWNSCMKMETKKTRL